MGIGHRIKSINNPDIRVKIIKEFVIENFPAHPLLDYALEVEKITTSKKPNLILNVDGIIATSFVDMLRNCGSFTRYEKFFSNFLHKNHKKMSKFSVRKLKNTSTSAQLTHFSSSDAASVSSATTWTKSVSNKDCIAIHGTTSHTFYPKDTTKKIPKFRHMDATAFKKKMNKKLIDEENP